MNLSVVPQQTIEIIREFAKNPSPPRSKIDLYTLKRLNELNFDLACLVAMADYRSGRVIEFLAAIYTWWTRHYWQSGMNNSVEVTDEPTARKRGKAESARCGIPVTLNIKRGVKPIWSRGRDCQIANARNFAPKAVENSERPPAEPVCAVANRRRAK